MIRLRVESFRGSPLPEPREATFDSSGGTVGRSENNKLYLPDPERHVSRIHAKVMCRDGRYSVADQGSNPVLLNGRPIGHGMTAPLTEGDVLAIGEYLIRVEAAEGIAPVAAPPAAATPVPAPPMPAAPPPAGSADPLGLFGDAPPPSSGGGTFDDLLGGGSPSMPDPFASIAPPPQVATPEPPPPPPPPAMPSAGSNDLFAGLGGGSSASSSSLGGIPDDFDPFADPFAAPPEKKPDASLPNDLGLSDAGVARNNYGESADLDSLFALDKGKRAPDPFAGSPLGDAKPAPGSQGSQDPLVAFGGAAAPIAPQSEPDNIPEIQGSFKIPGAAQIPDDTMLGLSPVAKTPPPPPKVTPQPPEEPVARPAASAPPAPKPPVTERPSAPAPRPAPPPPARATATAPEPDAPPPPPSRPAAPRPAEAPAAAPASAPAPAAGASSDELIAALKRGLRAGELPIEGPLTPQMMENIGALIRESTQGTLDLLLARAMTKREVRAEVTMIVSRGNNPLKFSPNIGMALSHLFGPPRKGFMTPTEAMRDAYNDLRSHQFGFMAGMRAALEGVLKRFTPDTLERRLTKKSVVDSLLPMNRKSKLWDLYNEMYQEISREAEDDFHTLFGKEFLRAYEEQIERLEQAQDEQA